MSQIALVTTFFTHAPNDELNNNLRIAIKNLGNPFIGKLLVMLEGQRDELEEKCDALLLSQIKKFENEGRLELRMIGHRPDYLSIFDAGRNLGSEYYLVANSDIVVDVLLAESLNKDIIQQQLSVVLALTRWNQTPSGAFIQTTRGVPPWLEIPVDDLHQFIRNYLSFDIYFLNRNIKLPPLLKKIPIGSLGCDTAISGLFRIHGSKVYNPCLSYRALHEDDKMRNHTSPASLGQQEAASYVIRDAFLDRFQGQENLIETIKSLGNLRYTTASIGRSAKKRGNWFNLYRIIGTCHWQCSKEFLPVNFRRIQIDAGNMVEKAEKILMAVIAGVTSNDFIEIQIKGGHVNEHRFLDLFIGSHPYLETAREILHVYDWQSVIFLDHATQKEQQLHDNTLYMLAEILCDHNLVYEHIQLKTQKNDGSEELPKNTGRINLLSKSLRICEGKIDFEAYASNKLPFLFRGMLVSEAGIEKNGGVYLAAPHDENWFALIYDGVVFPGDIVDVNLTFTVDSRCTLFIMLCREGYTRFESEFREASLLPGKHSITLNLKFTMTHPGIRIQVGSMDHAVMVTGIESSIRIQRDTELLTIGEKSYNIHEQVFKKVPQASAEVVVTTADGKKAHLNTFILRWVRSLLKPFAKK